jgi:molybdopterin-guanine dinucleotide biosynthesis protein A
MARGSRPEPCIALYRPGAAPILVERLARGLRTLHDAFPADRTVGVPVDATTIANANTPGDLSRATASPTGIPRRTHS